MIHFNLPSQADTLIFQTDSLGVVFFISGKNQVQPISLIRLEKCSGGIYNFFSLCWWSIADKKEKVYFTTFLETVSILAFCFFFLFFFKPLTSFTLAFCICSGEIAFACDRSKRCPLKVATVSFSLEKHRFCLSVCLHTNVCLLVWLLIQLLFDPQKWTVWSLTPHKHFVPQIGTM